MTNWDDYMELAHLSINNMLSMLGSISYQYKVLGRNPYRTSIPPDMVDVVLDVLEVSGTTRKEDRPPCTATTAKNQSVSETASPQQDE